MNPMSAAVLFAVVWFMVFFVVLPLRIQTQGEAGEVVPGTHSSAPANPNIKGKAKITTLVALVIWIGICAVIISEVITVEDLDFFNRLGPAE